jgi:hypothetical protein
VNALWVVPAGIQKLASGNDPERKILEYRTASARMRMGVAALEWKRAGHRNVFWNPSADATGDAIDWAAAAVCIVPKFYFNEPSTLWLEACRSARENGCRLVVDVTDYPFASQFENVRSFYAEALKLCDVVVVNSERMADMIASHVSCRPQVIDDAILGSQGDAAFAPADRLQLVWFGHRTNLVYLDRCLGDLARFAVQRQCRLTIVTEGGIGVEEAARSVESRFGPALEARFLEWSLGSMADALRLCDIVLIPGDPADPLKSGVSTNRIAECLNAGRFPVASPLPSYRAFADAAWLGDDLGEGLRWALENPAEVRARIQRGQIRVNEQLAAEPIGRQWRALFEELARLRA